MDMTGNISVLYEPIYLYFMFVLFCCVIHRVLCDNNSVGLCVANCSAGIKIEDLMLYDIDKNSNDIENIISFQTKCDGS